MDNNPSELQPLSALIEEVYAMAAGELPWAQLASRMAHTFEATSAQVQIARSSRALSRLTVTDNFQGRLHLYQNYFRDKDLWVLRAQERAGMSRVVISADLLTDAEMERAEFYQDWCRHLEVFYVAGAVFPTANNTLGVLGIHRPRAAGAFSESDRRRVAMFLPHLERAIRVWQHIGIAEIHCALAMESLDRCNLGILLLSADATVLYANPRAEALLCRGEALKYSRGRLSAEYPNEADRLLALIRGLSGLVNPTRRTESWLRIQGARSSIHVLFAPWHQGFPGHPAPAVVAFLRDPDRVLAVAAAAQALFGLTPTEAAIAEALVKGQSLDDIAKTRSAHV